MAKKTILVTMTGNRKTDRRLKRLRGKDQKRAVTKSARTTIKPVQEEAKQTAKGHRVTGTMAKGYKVRSMKRSRSHVGARVTIDQKTFPDEFHARFQELGWKAGLQKTKQPGHQDLKKAANKKRQAVLRRFHTGIRGFVMETTRK